jgi:uncharacterized protein
VDEIIVQQIHEKLAETKEAERIAIPLAVESGSRAWGFPSPDSDYDCRFVYVRNLEDQLSLFSKRDVIELPLTPVFDVNGWELAKAIKLLLKGNAVILEWLQSPIFYLRNEVFCLEMIELAEVICQRDALARHYLHLLLQVRMQHFGTSKDVLLKKIFYVLRPAMVLRYMRLNSTRRIVPMNFQELCRGSELPVSLEGKLQHLLERKSKTKELGMEPADSDLLDFVNTEAILAETWIGKAEPLGIEQKAMAEDTYRRLLKTYAPV